MNDSHLPLTLQARYGNLAQTFDRRPLETERMDFDWPLLHIRTLPRRSRLGRRDKKPVL